MDKTKISPEDEKKLNAAFDRYDRLLDFEKRLSTMINSLGIDELLGVPDYILAATAKSQMELTAIIIKAFTDIRSPLVLP